VRVRIIPTWGDARALPYADETFDAAYLSAVLGEIPDPERRLGCFASFRAPT
jgi:ubiquinone/menaquinone biosynthesis C-methylase UbiE